MIKKAAAILMAAIIATASAAVYADDEFATPAPGTEVNDEIRIGNAPSDEEAAAYAARLGQATATPEEQELIQKGAEAIENGTQEEFMEEYADEINKMTEEAGGIAATTAPEDRQTTETDPVNIFAWCFVAAVIIIGAVIVALTLRKKKK